MNLRFLLNADEMEPADPVKASSFEDCFNSTVSSVKPGSSTKRPIEVLSPEKREMNPIEESFGGPRDISHVFSSGEEHTLENRDFRRRYDTHLDDSVQEMDNRVIDSTDGISDEEHFKSLKPKFLSGGSKNKAIRPHLLDLDSNSDVEITFWLKCSVFCWIEGPPTKSASTNKISEQLVSMGFPMTSSLRSLVNMHGDNLGAILDTYLDLNKDEDSDRDFHISSGSSSLSEHSKDVAIPSTMMVSAMPLGFEANAIRDAILADSDKNWLSFNSIAEIAWAAGSGERKAIVLGGVVSPSEMILDLHLGNMLSVYFVLKSGGTLKSTVHVEWDNMGDCALKWSLCTRIWIWSTAHFTQNCSMTLYV
ncbi:hypothetical protein M427DRAFT_48847 [Gonapodya prolifera JEL478]|uniref:UBA domain-containing protein n=1 Tax=Gonapodya prolifera (strain JEL478) TaxID=1344416 RepID=A0A138ZZK0_GONPJ|nr:hypothetical protein M427DRAFT_48847 [Gonapodya prolifera JEL478]|eukprot:KXS09937.1 hypothetical protein M427DRAFT_48847 [Gonapodya prolifera JEL478]